MISGYEVYGLGMVACPMVLVMVPASTDNQGTPIQSEEEECAHTFGIGTREAVGNRSYVGAQQLPQGRTYMRNWDTYVDHLIVDSGASHSICHDRKAFVNIDTTKVITLYSGSNLRTRGAGVGMVSLTVIDEHGNEQLLRRDGWRSPKSGAPPTRSTQGVQGESRPSSSTLDRGPPLGAKEIKAQRRALPTSRSCGGGRPGSSPLGFSNKTMPQAEQPAILLGGLGLWHPDPLGLGHSVPHTLRYNHCRDHGQMRTSSDIDHGTDVRTVFLGVRDRAKIYFTYNAW